MLHVFLFILDIAGEREILPHPRARTSPVFSPQVSIRVRVEKPDGRPQARSGYTASLSRGFSSQALRRPCVLNSHPPVQCGASSVARSTAKAQRGPDAPPP